MPRTITKTIFQYSELSECAKEKAREWYQSCASAESDFDPVIEDAVEVAKLLGIYIDRRVWTNSYGFSGSAPKIYYSVRYCQSDNASFEGWYSYEKGATKRIRQYAPNDAKLLWIAESLQEIQKRYFYRLTANITKNHRGKLWVSVDYQGGAYRDISKAEESIDDCMQMFADWIYDQLREELDYQNSREAIEEAIEANEYEFYENGERV